MDQNTYFELGVKLALAQAGFSKEAGVMSALKALFKGKPPAKGSFEAWKKTDKAKKMLSGSSVTGTKAYGKYRRGGTLAKRRPQAA